MAQLRAVLFDLDGTLYDRDAALRSFAAEQHRLSGDLLGSLPAEQFIRDFVRLDANGSVGKDIVYGTILDAVGGDAAGAGRLHADYSERFHRHCRAAAETHAALAGLRARGLKLGVVTNGPTVFQRRTLAALDFGDIFGAVLISEAEGLRKPDPAIFLRAAESLGAEPASAVFVGDNPVADVGGARAAGMRGIWIRNAAFPPPAEADAAIASLAELPAILAAWVGSAH